MKIETHVHATFEEMRKNRLDVNSKEKNRKSGIKTSKFRLKCL